MPIDPLSGPDRRAANAAPEEPDGLARRLVRALVCAAVDRALPGVLLFDLEPELIARVAQVFTQILTGPGKQAAAPVVLGAASRDEDLWTQPELSQAPDGISFRLRLGPLIQADGLTGPPPLIVVPDLTRLSVAGMRAAVQLLGADVAVVEQAGLRHRDRPRARWLAACPSADAGRLSAHLLDRFAIRLPAAGLRLPPADRLLDTVPPAWLTAAAVAASGRGAPAATVTDEAIVRVRELLGPDTSVRRELALARLARTLATLHGERRATARHSDEAAWLMGLQNSAAAQPVEPGSGPTGSPQPTPRPGPGPEDSLIAPSRAGQDERRRPAPGRPLLETEPAEGIGSDSGGGPAALATPYPEDEAEGPGDFAPLRSPWQRTAGPASTRGVVVGTRRVRDLHDLAFVRTAREAAVHQRVRPFGRFTILSDDLHRNVRAGTAERLLVLVLDHTCRGDWDWQDALTPFLQWAYTERAAAHLIEVGSAEAADELRAEVFVARGVNHRRVLAALYRPPGRATPLAHGIEQAGLALRQAFQQHGNGLVEAWMVVVTDGRGNVPLRASHTGQIGGPVGAEGIEDTFKAAAHVSAMDRTRVHVAVVDAARQPYGDLPFALAETLGGTVIEGRSAERRGTDGDGGGGTRDR
ncbi:magnesium chelatase [Streptomyces sp. NBC_00038]|uniref:magnesium chelatase n=1 Tax=Streptomyces sp. NBC_00038 TaxID=2903615 RepID=UPI00224F0A68|nr:magnesium chelatase [Streptomyces sp. NBC_00038]MCX5560683.1 magnesium chelatase [Streptomyces sp. NBC_00038]